MQVIIDRFEGDFAVVEIDEGNFTKMPRLLLPGAKEGDVVNIIIDDNETNLRKRKINALMDELFED